MIGSTEILIIVSVVLVLFGASAIPKFARSLGRAKKEFEQGIKEVKGEEQKKMEGEKKENTEP
ncbi:Sec-independent protein translocase protein TatA [subsurface metagenome]